MVPPLSYGISRRLCGFHLGIGLGAGLIGAALLETSVQGGTGSPPILPYDTLAGGPVQSDDPRGGSWNIAAMATFINTSPASPRATSSQWVAAKRTASSSPVDSASGAGHGVASTCRAPQTITTNSPYSPSMNLALTPFPLCTGTRQENHPPPDPGGPPRAP